MIQVIAGAAVLSLVVGFGAGYKYTSDQWRAKEAQVLKAHLITVDAINKANRAKELEIIRNHAEQKAEIKYVIKKIPEYITADNCRVTDTGVQLAADQVRAIFPDAE